jgi:hypothetical protein
MAVTRKAATKPLAVFALPVQRRRVGLRRRASGRIIPLLSCWESQAEGIDERAQRREASLDRLDVGERGEVEPGQEQAGRDVGGQQQPKRVEVALPPRTSIPVRMGGHRGEGDLLLGGGGRRRSDLAAGGEVGALPADERVGAHHQVPPALAARLVGDAVVGPAAVVRGLLEARRGSCVRKPNGLPTVCGIVPGRWVMRSQVVSGGRWIGSLVIC